ncbi:hypothetical protein PG999_008299 [Apiospora kogelbergensis]|uniref:Uncharacterized protein n=1 Tax=Apiospora kogelbergensis TaxID=1337665 RepID=A0AAW0QU93_9PEZI
MYNTVLSHLDNVPYYQNQVSSSPVLLKCVTRRTNGSAVGRYHSHDPVVLAEAEEYHDQYLSQPGNSMHLSDIRGGDKGLRMALTDEYGKGAKSTC